MKKNSYSKLGLALAMASVFVTGCKDDKPFNPEWPEEWTLENYSVTPSLVKTLPGFGNVKIKTMISSDDQLENSPNFVYGAQPDGAGIIPDPSGNGFLMITNHEILQSVSRVKLDKNLKPVSGEYIVDAAGGMWRLCSATLATPQEHGFGPTFLTAGESGIESMIHAIDPMGSVGDRSRTDRTLPALGKCSAENAVPLPKAAYNNKTIIFIGEDESNPANSMGQVNMYVSNATGDLQNGKLYMLRRKDLNVTETDMEVGKSYDIEFVEYSNVKSSTGAQLATQTIDKKAIQFARVEDLDYGKGSPAANRTLYFTSTGVSPDKVNPAPGLTMWGRVYKLEMNANDPLKGKITPLIDGNEDPGNSIVNPDNICVTENYVYIQEDGDSFYQDNKHDGRIWQLNIKNNQLKPMLEMNHRRDDATFNAKYNPSGSTRLSSWEYGAMLDISDLTGKPGTFIVNIHPHTWRDEKFRNADGSGLSSNIEGGQTVILTNVPR
ncbi:PhoX family protein [Pontibacter harenae]|uniref:PhoX family protein n=1 Tax=Pontibacter harenae TaxID=2894083 RepID=UPI001E57E7C5|nr:PhoX family protein [Pontibacter harenae]MCC9167536.1 PhoX family protein [Pontibacter harenae]